MPQDEIASSTSCYVSPDQLRIGLYVYVDLPWFVHPFTLNRFRISSDRQIAELRTLELPRFRFDPERSDALNDEELALACAATPLADGPTQSLAHGDPVIMEKEQRARRLREHRRRIAQTEKGFLKASTAIRSITKSLLLRPKQAHQEMDQLVGQMAPAFLDRPDVSLHVMGERCSGDDASLHGLNVFILSMMLAKELDVSGEQAHALGIGALLHDIGKIEIPDRVLKKSPAEYTGPERELYARHVQYGLEIGNKLELGTEALAIIAQHHEMADGSGYPRGLTLEQIGPLARVVSLVNLYDKLCNPVAPGQALTPHEALSHIFVRRRDKFDGQILQLMIRTLGVYPPGSIVKLSNDAVAMVISVNLRMSLRPWVLLYDAGVPKHEAVMLDLEKEPGVNIAKFLRPALLAPAVYAYLNPCRRITYFFDGESPGTREPE